jgi:Mg2+ and Co2+ transporter CorA
MEVSEKTKLTLDLKTIGIIVSFAVSLTTMWYAVQADIEIAKKLPKPEVSRTEYDLKDQLIREAIMNTQEQVEANGKKLDLIESRLYELSTEAKRR